MRALPFIVSENEVENHDVVEWIVEVRCIIGLLVAVVHVLMSRESVRRVFLPFCVQLLRRCLFVIILQGDLQMRAALRIGTFTVASCKSINETMTKAEKDADAAGHVSRVLEDDCQDYNELVAAWKRTDTGSR
jgi:hypothetical protein